MPALLFAHSPRTGLGSNSTWAPLASNNAKTNECLEALLVFSPRCVRVCVCLLSLCSTCRQWVIFSRQFSDQELHCLIWLASCCRLRIRGNMLPSHIQVVCSQNKTKTKTLTLSPFRVEALAQSSLPYMYDWVFSTLLWRDSCDFAQTGAGAEVTTATQFGLICGFFGVSFL